MFIWNLKEESVWSEDRRYYYYIKDGKYHIDIAGAPSIDAYLGSPCDADNENWKEAIESMISEFQKNDM